jgi:hypothetical protein
MNISIDNYKIHDVIEIVAKTMKISPKDIIGESRSRHLVDARRIIINIVLAEECFSISETAKTLNKHHATAIHYRNTHESLCVSNPAYKSLYDICLKRYKKEVQLSFQDFLKLNDENSDLRKKIESLEEDKKELSYDILKLEKKVRMNNYQLV